MLVQETCPHSIPFSVAATPEVGPRQPQRGAAAVTRKAVDAVQAMVSVDAVPLTEAVDDVPPTKAVDGVQPLGARAGDNRGSPTKTGHPLLHARSTRVTNR